MPVTAWVQVALTICGVSGVDAVLLAYFMGGLNQRVKSQAAEISEHGAVLDGHGKALTDHERRIAHIEGQRGISLSSGD